VSGPLGRLQPADDGSVADWVFGALYPFERFDVGMVIPPGFKAYCCLLHSDHVPEGEVPSRLSVEDARSLAAVLESGTSTPDRCWFCLWSGWGWLHVSAGSIAPVGGEPSGWRDPLIAVERFAASAPLVGTQDREYHLFSGPVEAVEDTSLPSFSRELPCLWWPDDRAWIVATEIDLSWTYVGGASDLIDRVIAAWRFDGWRGGVDDPIRWDETG